MSEPRYVEDIFKRMFLWMSIGWIAIGLIMGFLGLIGVLKPAAHSMNQDSTESYRLSSLSFRDSA